MCERQKQGLSLSAGLQNIGQNSTFMKKPLELPKSDLIFTLTTASSWPKGALNHPQTFVFFIPINNPAKQQQLKPAE